MNTPQFGELERRAPELARVMIPLMRAYPDTVSDVQAVEYPSTLRTGARVNLLQQREGRWTCRQAGVLHAQIETPM